MVTCTKTCVIHVTCKAPRSVIVHVFNMSHMVTSINNRAEGTEGNFNEFYLNGEIGENAANLQKVKEGDVIEWRYTAEERDGSCGGVPDFDQIKSLLEYSAIIRNGYSLSFRGRSATHAA